MSTCPKCGGPMNFVEQYKQWYCYKCQQYGQPVQPAQQQPVQPYQQPPAHSQAYPQQQYPYQQPAQQQPQPAYQQYPAQAAQPAQQAAAHQPPRILGYKYTKITTDGHHTMEKTDHAPDIAKMFDSDPTLATIVVTKNFK